MRHRTINPTVIPPGGIQRIIGNLFGDNSHLLLNPHVTLVLFALSSLLVLCSSMVTYLYAYGRYKSGKNLLNSKLFVNVGNLCVNL